MSNDRQPNVVSFTFETSVDYDVDLDNGTVTRRDDGTIDGEHHYVALFAEGEFAGEYHLGDDRGAEDAALIERAEGIMDEAMRGGTVESEIEHLKAALLHLSQPNWGLKATGDDAIQMALYAKRALDKFGSGKEVEA